jgi:hypothetical protein
MTVTREHIVEEEHDFQIKPSLSASSVMASINSSHLKHIHTRTITRHQSLQPTILRITPLREKGNMLLQNM